MTVLGWVLFAAGVGTAWWTWHEYRRYEREWDQWERDRGITERTGCSS